MPLLGKSTAPYVAGGDGLGEGYTLAHQAAWVTHVSTHPRSHRITRDPADPQGWREAAPAA